MTIGIEATKAFEKEKTGVGWYAHYMIKEIAEIISADVELRLYVNPSAQISKSEFLISKQIPNSKFQIPYKKQCNNITTKQLSWLPKIFWTQGRLSLEMLLNQPDALFIPSHISPLLHPKKLVITIHDLAFKAHPEVYSKQELLMQEWGIRQTLKNAWRIIVPSQFTKDEIYKWYPRYKKNNIYVVAHGVDCDVFKTQNHNSKLKNIVYIGRLESKKNIVNLIKAFNLLCSMFHVSCSMTLIGPTGCGYKAIKKEINASPFRANINELGWLEREATATHLASATVLAFPSLYEGFGLPLLESFASGTPVACSDITALKEVGNGLPLYFDPHNPKDIAKKLAELLTNEALRKQKIAQGLSYARFLSWQKSAEKTLNVLMG